MRRLLCEFHKRVQLIYKEVVENSFKTISGSLGLYTSLPLRWDLALPIQTGPQSWLTMLFRWKPVESWEEAGADVEFAVEAPERFSRFDYLEVQSQLRELGRLTKHTHIWAGGGLTPRFDGYSITGIYTGETPVVAQVCKFIEDDLKSLFDLAPGTDS
jgi:hypothetical protein